MPPTLHPVLAWYPLVCPQHLFIDRQGETNAFYETNPAAIFQSDGTLHIAVRLVNYRKFHTRAFKMGGRLSESKYIFWKARLDEGGLTSLSEAKEIVWTNPFPKYPSVWTGYEDLRFLTHSSKILVTAPELNSSGAPRLVLGMLNADTATAAITDLLEPSATEKNWMPFSAIAGAEASHVIYSVSPLVVKRLVTPTAVTLVSEIPTLAGYHGSSNGVPYQGGHLFLIHLYKERTEHRWFYLNFTEKTYGFSDPFVFLEHSYIEFTCSLSEIPGKKEEFLVGLGVNDDKAFLLRVEGPTAFARFSFDVVKN